MRTIRTFIIGTLLVLGINTAATAQEVVFPLETGSWEFMLLAYDTSSNSYSTACFSYTATGDTTFNSKDYITIWNEYLQQPGYFRQEEQQVFYVPDPSFYSWNEGANEYVVYDFSLEEQDLVWLYSFTESEVDSAEVAVVAVDSMALDTVEMRKKIGFGTLAQGLPYAGCSLTWVEGIGQINYLPFYFWPSENMCVTSDYQTLFDCLSVAGETVYGSCTCIGFTDTEEIVSGTLSVSPNPTSGQFMLENLEGTDFEIVVFDKLGSVVLRTRETEIDLSAHPAGIYYVAAMGVGYRYTAKVVKY
ncbi:MAG: T9SS C-terminal target domain-containing protein [Bacteroidetes bacterium]|nr:MAG: T9SS C-terminal target domain-containing protein [Bacteroidota bacterium]